MLIVNNSQRSYSSIRTRSEVEEIPNFFSQNERSIRSKILDTNKLYFTEINLLDSTTLKFIDPDVLKHVIVLHDPGSYNNEFERSLRTSAFVESLEVLLWYDKTGWILRGTYLNGRHQYYQAIS